MFSKEPIKKLSRHEAGTRLLRAESDPLALVTESGVSKFLAVHTPRSHTFAYEGGYGTQPVDFDDVGDDASALAFLGSLLSWLGSIGSGSALYYFLFVTTASTASLSGLALLGVLCPLLAGVGVLCWRNYHG
jgi:hypothetical protein